MGRIARVLLIANPAAQRGNGAQAAAAAFDLLQRQMGPDGVELVLTERPRHATELAGEASIARYDAVVALGGDGVVHEVANGLMRLAVSERPAFGLVPVGSGNDYARTLGMSESVPEAVAQLAGAKERVFDVGKCNDVYFAETLSFGLDAAIALDTVQRRARTGEQGTALYLKSGLDQLLHHLDVYEFEARLGGAGGQGGAGTGQRIAGNMLMFAVQVGPTYGGGFRICPEARPDDGLFDICYAAAPMNMLEATVKFLSAKNAHHVRWKNIHFAQAAALELAFDRQPPCQVDGEPLVADAYSISTVPAALRVLCAK